MSDTPYEVEIALIQKELADLRDEMRSLSSNVEGLVSAWKTASGVVGFVKWLAGIVTALGIVWAALKIKITAG